MISLEDELLEGIRQLELERDLIDFKAAEQTAHDIFKRKQTTINEQSQTKIKELQVNQRIYRSSLINRQRLRKIKQRNTLCEDIFRQVRQQIVKVIKQDVDKYKLLLISLIVSGVIRMFESELLIRCLPQDQAMIEEIIPDCIECFNYKMDLQLGRKYPLTLEIDKSNPLKQWPSRSQKVFLDKHQEMTYCIGGVIVCNTAQDIVYKNTLDCRINILQEMSLPEIRYQVWRNH